MSQIIDATNQILSVSAALRLETEIKTFRTNKLFTVCSFILVVEMCERLCYYTLQGRIAKGLQVFSVQGYKIVL